MSEADIIMTYHKIKSNHYLSNCYRHIINSKIIHFLIIIIETALNVLLELDIILRDFTGLYEEEKFKKFNYINSIIIEFNKLSNFTELILLIIFVLIFDFLYLFLQRNNFIFRRIHIMIIINILELLYFRLIESIFLCLLFSFRKLYLLVSLFLLLPHISLIVNNFMYNHLYYFVPGFIEYPYDEFSSLYDIILFATKLLLGIICSSTNVGLTKFFFCILFLFQFLFSYILLYKLRNQSYLFMKNTFLNETRLCGFIIQPIIIISALLIGKNEILSILFITLNISFLFIIMGYVYFIYNPFDYVRIKMESPFENTIFYLYIISNKFMVDNLFESKLNEHFIKCGTCDLCTKYKNYLNELKKIEELENEENQNLIKEEKNNYNNNINDEEKHLMDLFNVIYNLKNKYFILIRNMAINYKIKGRDSLIKNADHYYINLSILMYSKLEKNELTLLLNEKLILEIINQKNHSILDNDQPQINQLLLCNRFVNLSNKIIAQFREILNCQQNLKKAEQLIDLSYMLKEMQNKEFKKNLFNQKQENNSVSKNMLSACSIIYEELFNTTISNSQTPLRDNIQQLEDIFNSNSNKNNNTISLSYYMNSKTCKIIRVGKDLCCHLNKNLFDVFPLIFKQYQINLFQTNILNNYYDNDSIEKSKSNNSYIINLNKSKINKNYKTIKTNKGNNAKADNLTKKISSKNHRKCVEIKIIICQNISSKIYYQLLTLKLTPLFSNENKYFFILDGVYNAHKYTVITSIDHEKSKNCGEEKINFISSPELEKKNAELYSMKFENYNKWLYEKGFVSIKLSSFDLSYKTYIIYLLNQKEIQPRIKVVKKINLKEEENEEQKENEAKKEKINLIEDNQSVSSQVTSNSYNKGFSGLGNKNKNKDSLQEYNGLNQIKLMIYMIIILVLLIFIFEFIHLFKYDVKIENCNDIFIKFKIFSKFYYQIFPLTLSIVCINSNENICNNIVSYYSNIYLEKFPQDDFNITLLLLIHNQRIADKMMETKGYTNEIHDIIGTKKYNQIFGNTINYLYVTQTYVNNKVKYSITSVEKKFYETILMMCNSFNSITENSNLNDIIYFLNKDDNPLMNLYEGESIKDLTNYQKDIYEMILNYNMYSKDLDNINNSLKNILIQTLRTNKIFIYIYLHLNILTIIFVSILIYLYLSFCEKIIIKILNFINMTINTKTNDFQFDKMFAEKLENLDIILKLYKISPIKALQNLIKLYNSYQSYITKKSKNEAMEISKRNNKKHFDLQKKELDNIPKNQMIIDKNGIKYLNITNKYYIILYAIIIITFSLYFFLLIKWNNYFNVEESLYILIEKTTQIEWAIYQGINIYYLMIFNNFTINEISKKMYPNLYNPKEDLSLLKSFYQNLINAFDIKKEIDELGNLYEIDISNFTCGNLYDLNEKIIEELNKTVLGSKLSTNIKNKLIIICEHLGVTDNNDPKSEFERHIQLIKNGLISIDDFDYTGLIDHLKSGNLGKISLLFNNVLIYLLEVYITNPNKSAIKGISKILKNDITIMEISFIIIDIIIIIIVLFIIIKIKQFSSQILLIKSVFKIYELQE